MTAIAEKILQLKFHGRIIDHLGIQMYQSPVAALAELVANAWDADAENIRLSLPQRLEADSVIVIEDDGIGMTTEECENRYLNIGYCRRATPTDKSPEKSRPILGRKGIGKFAGFGIAETIHVCSISKTTGEKTAFELNIADLRSQQYFIAGGEVPILEYAGPDENRKADHGTKITLKGLRLSRSLNKDSFAKSMSRRFLLHQRQDSFRILVNGFGLPDDDALSGAEFVFPRNYAEGEKPSTLQAIDSDGWGRELVTSGKTVRWRIVFHKETIDQEELRGVVIFANGKLAQTPFLFNITGGLKGQHGVEYLSGQVEADFLDATARDIIATDRQAINWDDEEAQPLLEWGSRRVKELLALWQERRGEQRRIELENRLAGFSARLERLPRREAATVKRALAKIGSIATLTSEQFEELGNAVLTSWEHGRLKDLIEEISTKLTFTTDEFLNILTEAHVLSALNLAEAVRTKLEAIRGLKRLIERKELENAVRDYIAKDPWLLNPDWETYKVETSLKHVLDDASEKADLSEEAAGKRVDLALRSGNHLIVVEFVRPGKKVDWDHLSRCRRYILNIRSIVGTQTQLGIWRVTGLIVADELDSAPDVVQEIKELEMTEICAYSWDSLLSQAGRSWREFLDILIERAPEDERIQALRVSA